MLFRPGCRACTACLNEYTYTYWRKPQKIKMVAYGGMCTNAREPRLALSAGPHAAFIFATVNSIQSATFASTQSGKAVEFAPSLKPPDSQTWISVSMVTIEAMDQAFKTHRESRRTKG